MTDDKNEFKALKNDGIKTVTKKFEDRVKEVLDQLQDMATLEVLLPVDIRMKKRMESIRQMSSAKTYKIDRHFKTIAPKMHITGLEGRKISNNECEIRFNVYAMDENGNKKLFEQKAEMVLHNGEKVQRTVNAEYRVAYEVVESIKYKQPITREVTYTGVEEQ